MERLQRLFGNLPGIQGQGGVPDGPVVDTAEKIHISSLALLKMLKHGLSFTKLNNENFNFHI